MDPDSLNPEPDPGFFLNPDPDTDPDTNTDPDPNPDPDPGFFRPKIAHTKIQLKKNKKIFLNAI